MTYERKFREEKQLGTLYHFTSIARLEDIINSDYILKSNSKAIINDKHIFTISFTRDFALDTTWTRFSDVRISVDGTKLSNKYKIVPYADFPRNYKKEREEALIGKTADIKNSIIKIDIKVDEDRFNDLYPQEYNLIKKQNIKFNFVDKFRH